MAQALSRKVLIAEPDQSISETLKEFLIHIGYEADTVDRRESIAKRAGDEGFSVVLLDQLLNSSRGVDTLDELRSADSTVCVIMLISYPLVEYVITAFRKGACDVVIKPVDLHELGAIVGKAFRQHELNKAYKYVTDNIERIDELVDSVDRDIVKQLHEVIP